MGLFFVYVHPWNIPTFPDLTWGKPLFWTSVVGIQRWFLQLCMPPNKYTFFSKFASNKCFQTPKLSRSLDPKNIKKSSFWGLWKTRGKQKAADFRETYPMPRHQSNMPIMCTCNICYVENGTLHFQDRKTLGAWNAANCSWESGPTHPQCHVSPRKKALLRYNDELHDP